MLFTLALNVHIFLSLYISQYKFDCKLERIESSVSCHISRVEYFALLLSSQDQCRLDVESDLTDLQACTTSVNDWLTKGVWSTVAVSAILIAFQVCHVHVI